MNHYVKKLGTIIVLAAHRQITHTKVICKSFSCTSRATLKSLSLTKKVSVQDFIALDHSLNAMLELTKYSEVEYISEDIEFHYSSWSIFEACVDVCKSFGVDLLYQIPLETVVNCGLVSLVAGTVSNLFPPIDYWW